MERLNKMKRRLVLYGLSLAVLLALLLLSLWSVLRTGAFLTSENDWQGLAGDYRIGTIDYTVHISDSYFLDPGGKGHDLAVPLLGGVRIFDASLTDKALRGAEFGEGATLVRMRIVNRSASMVDVTALLALTDGGNSSTAIRALPLPLDLSRAEAERLDERSYVLGELKVSDPAVLNDASAAQAERDAAEVHALADLETQYRAYYPGGVNNEFPIGLLRGAVDVDGAEQPPDTVVVEGQYCSYKDIFLLVWSDYGAGEYNSDPAPAASAPPRQARFSATFTVGQLD